VSNGQKRGVFMLCGNRLDSDRVFPLIIPNEIL
jgi:hypothetical protein